MDTEELVPELELEEITHLSDDTPKRSAYRIILDILETLIISLLLFIAINFLTARVRVVGTSMEPTLHNGEFILVYKLAYTTGDIGYGDVIVFRPPDHPDKEYIKRVIGLPNDEVSINGGVVTVNNRVLEEPYIKAPPNYQKTLIVPGDTIFVLGDNRNNSDDSNKWGPLPIDNVLGKAIFVYWPPQEWGLVDALSIVSAGNR